MLIGHSSTDTDKEKLWSFGQMITLDGIRICHLTCQHILENLRRWAYGNTNTIMPGAILQDVHPAICVAVAEEDKYRKIHPTF